jgi:hypothetical protein
MVLYLAVGILILVPAIMLILRSMRRGFAYPWLPAITGALVAWLAVLALGLQIPQIFKLGAWGPEGSFIVSPSLLVDQTSWLFAAAVATLLLATILTDVARPLHTGWLTWTGALFLTALGLLGVLAANPLTLVLAWSAYDLAELGLVLFLEGKSESRRGAIASFAIRVVGSFSLLTGISLVTPTAGYLSLSGSPQAHALVFLAAFLRLAVLPVNPPALSEKPLRASLGTISRLMAASTAMVLLVRTTGAPGAQADQSIVMTPWMALFGLFAIYAGASWLLAGDALDGRPAWILGLAMMTMASALRGQADAALAWALACVFSGGLVFLSSVRTRISSWIAFAGILGIAGVPYSPAWAGTALFAPPFDLVTIIFFLFTLILFLSGYYRHTIHRQDFWAGGERWVNALYFLGLALLPLTHIVLGFFVRPSMGTFVIWVIGPIAAVLAAGWVFWEGRGVRFPGLVLNMLDSIFSLRWTASLLALIYQIGGRFIYFLSRVMEGDGGVLWVLLLVTLLIASLVIGSGATP